MRKLSRRELLKSTAVAGYATLFSSWFAPGRAGAETGSLLPRPVAPGTFSYFSQAEITFLDAAVARLIPSDILGPGAQEAGVPLFIDQQMAGPFGRAETWYMQGPWRDGTTEQGYQLKLTPAQLYRVAIREVDDYCRHTFDNKAFAELTAADQDKLLHALEKGDITLSDAPAKEFFAMLWQNIEEGFFADPLYGGNREFAGWKLVGFPGPRYNYLFDITNYGRPYTLPTVGLLGRDASARRKGQVP